MRFLSFLYKKTFQLGVNCDLNILFIFFLAKFKYNRLFWHLFHYLHVNQIDLNNSNLLFFPLIFHEKESQNVNK